MKINEARIKEKSRHHNNKKKKAWLPYYMTEYFAKNELFVSWISGSTQEEQSDADNVNFLVQCLRMLYYHFYHLPVQHRSNSCAVYKCFETFKTGIVKGK